LASSTRPCDPTCNAHEKPKSRLRVSRDDSAGRGVGCYSPRHVRPMTRFLEIRLLGPFEVFAGGLPTEISGSKRHALLALLALRRGRVVSVDELVGGLWG